MASAARSRLGSPIGAAVGVARPGPKAEIDPTGALLIRSTVSSQARPASPRVGPRCAAHRPGFRCWANADHAGSFGNGTTLQ